jgi:two-component system cell cycle response regulator
MAKARILIVEDSKSQADLTRAFLERNGYDVLCVHNGAGAIKAAKTASYDVILLDLVLPDMNGNEICRWLKLNSETRGIPIIMLTVESALKEKVAAIEAGADDYLPKPYNEIELNARIYAALRTKALQDELRDKNRQLEELLAKVELQSITDPLTGLYNRRYVESVLVKELAEWKRYGSPLACLMVDVDHFKDINDRYGHETGDSVLMELAALLKDILREADTVARWGGEEFLILLPQTGQDGASVTALKILRAVTELRLPQIPDLRVTVSIGIAPSGRSTDTPAKLVRAADLALYEAKNRGRNRIESAPEKTPWDEP